MPSMEEKKQVQLVHSLNKFLEMQTEQMGQLEAGKIKRIQEWIEIRQETLARLRARFAALSIDGIERNYREELLAKLRQIMDLELNLQKIASQRSREVMGKISRLRRGKKALNGYGPGGRKSAPRFLSSLG